MEPKQDPSPSISRLIDFILYPPTSIFDWIVSNFIAEREEWKTNSPITPVTLLHPFSNRCRTGYVGDWWSTAVLWRGLPWAITYLFGGGFNARALSRIAADATTHIRPKARRERSPAPPGPTCAATSRRRQNPSSRAIARAFFKELEIETRAKPPPRFRERSPYTPVHMCSALIHATSPRERFAAESKSSPRRPAHRDDRALRRTRPPGARAFYRRVAPEQRTSAADKRLGAPGAHVRGRVGATNLAKNIIF